MISIATEMTQISKLFMAAENKDIRELYKLYTENPYLLHGGGLLSWGENPPHVACKSGNLQFVKEVIKINPLLARRRRNNYGSSPTHVDCEGNSTVLDIATSYKLIKILELLLIANGSTNAPFVDVNSMNERGYTALDVHDETSDDLRLIANGSTNAPFVDVNSMNERGYTALDAHDETSNDLIAREVPFILLDPGDVKRRLLSVSEAPERRSSKIPIKVINLLLMVFIMAATILFAASCSPPKAIQLPNETATVSIWDMVIGPSHFQVIFLYMMCSMVGFIVSMGVILVLLWPHPYRVVTTFVLAILVVVYILVVDINMPKFSVIMGSSRIASDIFMGFSTGIFILCGFTALILGKLCGCFNQNTCEEVACGDLMV